MPTVEVEQDIENLAVQRTVAVHAFRYRNQQPFYLVQLAPVVVAVG